MTKSLNDILKRYSDALSGKRESKVSALTTGDNPGVDYADKMKDARDFIAQHSVEKFDDRVGNGDGVYNASKVQKAKMERHGHEPKPKDIKVYKKNQQVGQPENVKEEAEQIYEVYRIGVTHTPDGHPKSAESKFTQVNVSKATSSEEAIARAKKLVKKKYGSKIHDAVDTTMKEETGISEKKDESEYGYEGDMAITQLKTICRNSENIMKMLKPKTDLPEWVQSKITKAEDYISTANEYLSSEMTEEFEQIDELTGKKKKLFGKDPLSAVANRAINRMKLPPNDGSKLSPEEIASNNKNRKVSQRAFDRMGEEVEELDEAKCNMSEADTMCETHGMKACPKKDSASEPRYNGKDISGKRKLLTDRKIQETLSDQRSSSPTASEKAREKISDALEKRKQIRMKEQSAPAETPITMPSGAVGDTGRV